VHCSSFGAVSGGNAPFVFVNQSLACEVNESSGALGTSHIGNSFYLTASPGRLDVQSNHHNSSISHGF
jgi:hypothetical protein